VSKKVDRKNWEILQILDKITKQTSIRSAIESIVSRVEQKLNQDSEAKLAWEPIPLFLYGKQLPNGIRSSWVFIIPPQTTTGAERHPNSYQRMMSYRGSGDLQIWDGDKWNSNILVSDLDKGIGKRWVSIPTNIWHQAVVGKENWVVVSFHTVPDDELIEERPESTDSQLFRQRKYLDC